MKKSKKTKKKPDSASRAVTGKVRAQGETNGKPAKRQKTATKAGPKDRILGVVDKVRQFLREVRIELNKVTWPTRKDTIASTSVVLVIVILIAAFLGIVDLGLSKMMRFLLN